MRNQLQFFGQRRGEWCTGRRRCGNLLQAVDHFGGPACLLVDQDHGFLDVPRKLLHRVAVCHHGGQCIAAGNLHAQRGIELMRHAVDQAAHDAGLALLQQLLLRLHQVSSQALLGEYGDHARGHGAGHQRVEFSVQIVERLL